jgi:hypothetical protein
MTPAERTWIEELLAQDPPPSCRAISRITGISDWTIRRVKRERDGNPRPMKQRRSQPPETTEEVSTLTSWLVFGGVVVFFALAIWTGARWAPPPEPPESTDWSPRPYDDRKENDET